MRDGNPCFCQQCIVDISPAYILVMHKHVQHVLGFHCTLTGVLVLVMAGSDESRMCCCSNIYGVRGSGNRVKYIIIIINA